MAILLRGNKTDNFKSHNSLTLNFTDKFVQILLSVNLFLNQTLRTSLLYVRQTWMTQLILTIQNSDS